MPSSWQGWMGYTLVCYHHGQYEYIVATVPAEVYWALGANA